MSSLPPDGLPPALSTRTVAPTSAVDAFLAERLNQAQREAVTAGDGPLLILAGAGSGKTRVIAYRIAYLVMERRVPPEQIMAVTFTNKAAAEMRERVEQLIGPAARAVMLGTFHSICARLLRRDIGRIGYASSFCIYDDEDQLALLKRLYVDAGLNPKQHAPQAVRAEISRAKEKLFTPSQYAQIAESPFEIAVSALYRRYQAALQEQNALDFDDLLVLTLRLLDEAPDVLHRYRKRFRHVLVDEYQDVNKAQYLLVKLLAEEHRNLTIVGDDSQAIYGWRGADVRYILEFEHDFPECRVVRLEQNYRSTRTILEAAHAVERGLSARRDKTLWTENEEGPPLTLCHAPDEREEAMFVVREIEKLQEDGFTYGEIAVMYRMNSQSRALEEAFVRRRVPYQLVGGTRFYERREVKDIVAYLRLVNNPSDSVSLERIINVPSRGIGEKTLDDLGAWASDLGVPLGPALMLLRQHEAADAGAATGAPVPPPFGVRPKAQLLAFAKLLADLAEASHTADVVTLFDTIVLRTGYREHLLADKAGEERWENVMELRSVLSQYSGLDPRQGLRAFLDNVALVNDVDAMKDQHNQVTLMTLHAAKGLEFPVVFITGLEEGIFPHSRALEANEIDEERRLCYVGVTRAKQRLYLITCAVRTVYGMTRPSDPSRFLLDLASARLREVNSMGMTPTGFAGAVRRWSGNGQWIGGGSTRRTTTADERRASVEEARARRASRTGFGPLVRLGSEVAPLPARRPVSASGMPPMRVSPSDAAGAAPTYKAGDRVRHSAFGEGVVVESTMSRSGEETVRVQFAGGGPPRLFLAASAPMEVVEEDGSQR